jgi:serine/threonine protein kinase
MKEVDKGTILRTAANRYVTGKCLGRGAQGSVYEAFRGDGRKVAVKLVREITADSLRRQRTEGWTYQQFSNQFVALLDWNLEWSRPFLVLEFCIHGSARSQMNYLSTWHSVSVPLIAQMARALEELHKHGYLFRDFKPDNILLTQYGFGSWIAKLGDAGLICLPQELSLIQMTNFARGTYEYMAPELLRFGALYTREAEAFAFGVTAAELLSGTRPTAGSEVLCGPVELRPLLTNMISVDPRTRPSLIEARSILEIASQNLKERNQALGAVGLVALVVLAAFAFGKGKK